MEDSGFKGGGSNAGRFGSGSPIYANQLNKLANVADNGIYRPSSGNQGNVVQSPAGISQFVSAANFTPAASYPFKVVIVGSASPEPGFFFTVRPGTFNGYIPTLNGTRIDDKPFPGGPKANAHPSGKVYIKATTTEEEGVATFPAELTIHYTDTAIPDDTDTAVHYLIAWINISTDGKTATVAQNLYTSIWADRLKCGTDPATYFLSKI
jgi:hypothetical protein